MPFPIVDLGAVLHRHCAGGGFNALIIVFAKLNPVIVTLATNFIGLAALYLVFQQQVPLNSDIYNFGCESWFGLSAIFWPMLGSSSASSPRTRYGRRMIAVGNRAAAKARGISLKVTRFATFIAAVFCWLRRGVVCRHRRAVQLLVRQPDATSTSSCASSSPAFRWRAAVAISGCCCSRSASSPPSRRRWPLG